jgi:hypothetical protein
MANGIQQHYFSESVLLVIRCDKPNHAFGKGRHYIKSNTEQQEGALGREEGRLWLQRNADSSSNVIET